ncbi:MAG: response regulator [Treponema sp.]|jgi:DNA-binding response OmpR family regulator|nr:response regulator [Treponema sp.]
MEEQRQRRRQKILIVDDEDINLEFFDLMLSKLGFLVELACNGREALDKVARFHPDLIMLDNIMPKMSGWEVTKILKNDAQFRDIPIIMLSSLDDVKEKVESFEMGVDDYITKPFSFSEVLARIRAVLRTRVLVTQITLHESRLQLAETISKDFSAGIADLAKSMDELDAVIEQTNIAPESLRELFEAIKAKTHDAHQRVLTLEGRIEEARAEWNNLKNNEINLTAALDEEPLDAAEQTP